MTTSGSVSRAVTTVESDKTRAVPPNWAVRQRHLIDAMDRAAVTFVERYTRPDGTLVWRDEWPGMDGSDDAYESFVGFPLFYLVGGGEHVHELARREWDAVTRQFTEYGQVHNEFDGYYDWMHHGESYTYLHYLGLADPTVQKDRERALRFAGMYLGEDPEAPNWDPGHKLIRSPINGSRGPQFEMTAEDWCTHREVLAKYLAPYEDTPGYESEDPLVVLDWNDDEVFGQILRQMNQRMVPGDVPLNLNATSLVANAFMYSGEDKYREWVTDYADAWAERTRRNNGITPDNVGPSGVIGERMDGKWWGGYYGWRWPHGAWIICESTLIGGSNAALLSGDRSHLDTVRSQLDRLWSLRKEEDGVVKVPGKHGDKGWFAYSPPNARFYAYLYNVTQDAEDLKRLDEHLPNWSELPETRGFSKGGTHTPLPWLAYVLGKNPGYPEEALRDTSRGMNQRLQMASEDSDNPAEWDVHHWQNRNPVVPEGLVQMTMASPGAVYHGGLLHARVRHFDPVNGRPGLPQHVAALVEALTPDSVTLVLVNADPLKEKDVVVQAGAFGEHDFTEASLLDADGGEGQATDVASRHLHVHLAPAAQVRLRVGMRLLVNPPTYAFPWD